LVNRDDEPLRVLKDISYLKWISLHAASLPSQNPLYTSPVYQTQLLFCVLRGHKYIENV
jgi:hypothetical protein